MGIGVWAVADKIYIADIIGAGLFRSAAYLMVASGIILILISFLGCIGAISGKRLLVFIFLCLLILVFILLMTTAILAAVFQDDIESNMEARMEMSIREQYGYDLLSNAENAKVTLAWDKAQTSLMCCGVKDEGWGVYRSSRWFQKMNAGTNGGFIYNPNSYQGITKYVPESCCVFSPNLGTYLNTARCQSNTLGPPGDPSGSRNDALQYGGCYDAARRFIVDQSTMMLGLGFSFSVFLLSGVIISILFLRKLGASSEGRADLRYR